MNITVKELIQKLLDYPMEAKVKIEISRKLNGQFVIFNMQELDLVIANEYPNEILIIADKL